MTGDLADVRLLSQATTGSEGTASRGRAVAPLLFFNDVVEAMNSSSTPFGKGQTFLYEMKEVVPRLLWKAKPEFLSTQILIRRQLGMSLVDNSPHPILQFYYEFGWPGIALGFLAIGFSMRWIVNRMDSVFMFLIFAF